MLFNDRRDAGKRLAARLKAYSHRTDVIVLALPRGGVVTGHEIACLLHCPLDILIVHKLGFPGQPELAIGAVSETGAVSLNRNIIGMYGITREYVNAEVAKERGEIERRVGFYRERRGIPPLEGRILILVDDGMATGATVKAAISTLKESKGARLIAAIPVASKEAAEDTRKTVDELICLDAPEDFMAVGNYYRDFTQVTDEEVVALLKDERCRLMSEK